MQDYDISGFAGGGGDAAAAARVNAVLRAVVTAAKGAVETASAGGAWDQAKTHTNPYELVYKAANTSSPPVSRAFWKMWEMASVLGIAEVPPGAPLRVGYVAEGPGGFVQALVAMRGARGACDRHTAMTLVSRRRQVPHWKLPSGWLHAHGVTLVDGEDGSGDVYRPENARAFARAAGPCDLVTADGGFDFSFDFNAQERAVLRLIIGELLCATTALRPGGTFLLKVFDCLGESTGCVIQCLVAAFDSVRCVKPLTSRPANAERYLVCRGFRPAAGARVAALAGRWLLEPDQTLEAAVVRDTPPDPGVFCRVASINIAVVSRQIAAIVATLAFISARTSPVSGSDAVDAAVAAQRRRAGAWVRRFVGDRAAGPATPGSSECRALREK